MKPDPSIQALLEQAEASFNDVAKQITKPEVRTPYYLHSIASSLLVIAKLMVWSQK